MQSISRTRIFIVAFVTIISLFLTYPTARYYMFLRQGNPAMIGAKPTYKTAPPKASDTVAFSAWAKENPEYAKWMDANKDYLAWEAKDLDLRQSGLTIPLGLDLIGGVDVTLVLDREKAVDTEINNTVNSLSKAMENEKISVEILPKGQGFTVKLMNAADAQNAAKKIGEFSGILDGVPSVAELATLKPVSLTLQAKDLNRRLTLNLDGAKTGISDRVDRMGVTQPRVSKQGEDRIRVQVPGYKDPDALINQVIQPAILEFHLVDKNNEQLIDPTTHKLRVGAHVPAGSKVFPMREGRVNKDTRQMVYTESEIVLIQKAPLTGKDLRSASVQMVSEDLENPIQVSLSFNDDAAKAFADLTGANVGRRLAIVLDGVVRSAPNLNEKISQGSATIRGGFTQEEATALSQFLKAGSLKAPLKIESKRTVGATLGKDSIMSGVKALAIGSVIITIVMIGYYGTAGVISVFALFLHILIILALMSLSHATMTLSGIGGILLTIGMAVDANILIYERMREEVRAGKPLKQAIGLGFHRAFSVILDSNVTTLLSALVLLQFTEGSVLGFALTMAFGIVANLFTGLTVTYTLCGLWFNWRGSLSLGRIAIFKNTAIKFVEMRFLSWGGSSTLGLIALVLLIIKGGLIFGVDFAGGYRAEVQFKQKPDVALLRSTLDHAGLSGANIQSVTDPTQPNYYIIDMSALETTSATQAQGKNKVEATPAKTDNKIDLGLMQSKFESALNQVYKAPGDYKIVASSGFGPETSKGFKWLAFWVTVLSSSMILLYLWFRFELVFGVAAVVALLHDLAIVFMLACVWGVQVNLEVVAAMMVLMGFSVNDTIVIFDRIRENTRLMPNKSFGEVCDLAMNQCLSRTILTSGTVFLAAMCLFLVGGEGLSSFAKIYVIGTIVGTYSSDFIAAPIVYQWNKFKGDRVRQMLAVQKKRKEAAKPIRAQV